MDHNGPSTADTIVFAAALTNGQREVTDAGDTTSASDADAVFLRLADAAG